METLFVLEPVGVRDDSVRCVTVGQQIKLAGSAVPAVRFVEHSKECVVNGSKKLLVEHAVDVSEGVKGERRRVVGVLDGRCFGDSRAGRDDGPCAGIEKGDQLLWSRGLNRRWGRGCRSQGWSRQTPGSISGDHAFCEAWRT